MSWLSVAWTRAKGTASALASAVPIVGGAIAHVVDGIHTGDEHQNQYGEWVSNATGELVAQPPSAALQAQIDATNQFNRDEAAHVRQAAADLAAKAGIAAGAAIGPPGNIYQQMVNAASRNPLLTGVVVIGALALVYFAIKET